MEKEIQKNNKDKIPWEHYKALYEKLDPGESATELLEKVRAIAQPAKTEA